MRRYLRSLSPEQMQALGKVADSLAETRLSKDGALTGSGSPTAQRQSGAVRVFVGKLAEQLGGLVSGGAIGGALGFAAGGPGGQRLGLVLERTLAKCCKECGKRAWPRSMTLYRRR